MSMAGTSYCTSTLLGAFAIKDDNNGSLVHGYTKERHLLAM